MSKKPVNWLVCSRDGLSDEDWHTLRQFVASEFEKDAASAGRNAERQDPPSGLGPKDEHAVGAKGDETPKTSHPRTGP